MSILDSSYIERYLISSTLYLSLVIGIFVLIGNILLHLNKVKRVHIIINTSIALIFAFSSILINKNIAKEEVLDSWIYKIPFIVFILTSLITLAINIYFLVDQELYKRKHITLHSIKDSIDCMNTGLIAFDENGSIFMMNNTMENLSIILTNSALVNGLNFYEMLKKEFVSLGNRVISNTNDEIIIKLKDERIFSFKIDQIMYNNISIYRMIANDISIEYKLNLELLDNYEKLKNYNSELKKYGNSVIELTRNEELLNAKVKIHDRLGEILLLSRRITDESSIEEKENLLEDWLEAFDLFRNTNDPIENKTNKLEELLQAAHDIGVEITINGVIPDNNIFYIAIHECLTNTVKHGKGNKMFIDSYYENNRFIFKCSNNGKLPYDFKFKGGLLSLKEMVKKENGYIYVDTTKRFTLIIEL